MPSIDINLSLAGKMDNRGGAEKEDRNSAMKKRPAGIVTGLQLEARIARKAGSGVLVSCRGMGPKRAREAAEELVRRGARGLVSFGFAAGLVAEAAPGMLFVPSTIRTAEGGMITTDMIWRERLLGSFRNIMEVSDAPLASVRRPLPSYLDKASAWARTQGAAADMESAAIAAVARRAGIPFVVVRAVADPVDFNLPPAASVAVGMDGRIRPWRLLMSLWRYPVQMRALRELAEHARRAKSALRKAVMAAGPDFALNVDAKKPENRNTLAH